MRRFFGGANLQVRDIGRQSLDKGMYARWRNPSGPHFVFASLRRRTETRALLVVSRELV